MTGVQERAHGERVLAIDGPAGAGKSTVAKACSVALGLPVLDTGAMYRAVTLACLRSGVALDDGVACGAIAGRVTIELVDSVTRLDGEDVSQAIRGPEVTAAVSSVSAHPAVRVDMVAHQRVWATAHDGGVVEGRDIGSVVFPDARCKIFLIASPAARAKRRQLDEAAAGRSVDLAALVADIERRDALDANRAASPLLRPVDAVEIDTTGRTIDDVVTEIADRYRSVNP
jgi:cytidylate kinase